MLDATVILAALILLGLSYSLWVIWVRQHNCVVVCGSSVSGSANIEAIGAHARARGFTQYQVITLSYPLYTKQNWQLLGSLVKLKQSFGYVLKFDIPDGPSGENDFCELVAALLCSRVV